MVTQKSIRLPPHNRGFHIVTSEILNALGDLPEKGLLNLFLCHTSAGLSINEAADPDVLHDFELYFNKIIPERLPGIRHTIEGSDDMPAHIKSAFTGVSLTIPIQDNSLVLGTWQGIYLCEFRNRTHSRKILATLYE